MILRKNSFNKYLFLFVLLILLQIVFWRQYKNLQSDLDIVSSPPSEKTIKIFTFGDNEFYFRLKSFKVQNMGDTFGRFTSFKKYDYNKLYDWFIELEKLNYKSSYLPALTAYYFSQTPIKEDKLYIVKFLEQYSLKNPEKRWWWLYQASYIANYGVVDKDLAIKLALKLKDVAPENAPLWAKQTAGIFLSKNGDSCEAVRVISEVMNELESNNTKTDEEKDVELNYMKFFLETEIKKLKEKKDFNIEDCFNNNRS